MQISDVTGLPELPKDRYWRITETNFHDGSFGKLHVIRIRKSVVKRGFPFFKKDVEVEEHVSEYSTEIYRHMIRYHGVDFPVIILETAKEAYEEWKKQVKERSVTNTIADYLGNYPPRSLDEL